MVKAGMAYNRKAEHLVALSLVFVLLFSSVTSLSFGSSRPATESQENDTEKPPIIISLGKEGFENGSPSSIAINQKTNLAYVSNRNADSIVVINSTTNMIVGKISVGFGPRDIAVNSNTNTIYVTRPVFGSVIVIDGQTNQISKTLEIGPAIQISLDGIVVNEKNNRIYVLVNNNYSEQTRLAFASIAIIDGLTNTLEEHSIYVAELEVDHDVMDNARDIAINPETNTIYVVLFFGNMYVVNGSRGIVTDKISIGYEKAPHRVSVNEMTNMVYTSNFGNRSISIVNGSNNEIVETVEVGQDPQGIAIDTTSNRIHVVTYDNAVSVVDGFTNKVIGKIEVGEFPERAAFNANNGLLYVSNTRANSMSIIDTNSMIQKPEWKTVLAAGNFLYSDPPKPDQIFKAYYRVINGTIEKLAVSGTKLSSSGNGTLEIMWPQNYPYTNEEGNTAPNAESPLAIFDAEPYPEFVEVTLDDITDCFFVFSIPFTGNQSIALVWSYLLTNLPYHGDEIPDSCTPQTLVENVPTRKDGTITPLQQFKAGVAAEHTVCPPREQGEERLMLLISPKGKPYCVKISDEGFMKRHGWTEPYS